MLTKLKKKVDQMEDRLSNLPDDILTEILSRLSTKESVQSSILSRRWKSLWLSVSTFEFLQNDFDYKRSSDKGFSEFLNEVLLDRKLHLLEKVKISTLSYEYAEPSEIILWLRAALKRNVTDLDVEYGNTSLIEEPVTCFLPRKIFSYNKLVKLRLNEDISLRFHKDSSRFPNLKYLALDRISYENDDTLRNLLFSCPALENLYIRRSRWDHIEKLDIASNSLKILTVDCDVKDEQDHETAYENFETIIDTPDLEYLDITCFTTRDYTVKDLSSLDEAKLHFYDVEYDSDDDSVDTDYIKCYFGFLTGIRNVEFLTLESSIFKALTRTDSWNLPVFQYLTSLTIKFDQERFERTKFPVWRSLIEILKSSPVLENLEFSRDIEFFHKKSDKSIEWDVPDCFASHLKTVEIDFYYKGKDDKAAMKFFLANAKVLETMTIWCSQSRKLLSDVSAIRIENLRGPASTAELVKGGVLLSFP